MCVSDLQIFVPPSFCIRNKQSLLLCSVCFFQTVLSRQNFVCDRCGKFWSKFQSNLQHANSYFVQRTCRSNFNVKYRTLMCLNQETFSTAVKQLLSVAATTPTTRNNCHNVKRIIFSLHLTLFNTRNITKISHKLQKLQFFT